MRLSLVLLNEKTNQPLVEWSGDQVRDIIKKKLAPWYVSRWLLLKVWDQIVQELKQESVKV